jgi:hypothetical protein
MPEYNTSRPVLQLKAKEEVHPQMSQIDAD